MEETSGSPARRSVGVKCIDIAAIVGVIALLRQVGIDPRSLTGPVIIGLTVARVAPLRTEAVGESDVPLENEPRPKRGLGNDSRRLVLRRRATAPARNILENRETKHCLWHCNAKLTATQRMRLKELVLAGPQAAGYASGCWNSALIQDLMMREFKRTYNLHYISQLLHNLGFSYQKARFVSDYLDEQARKHWREVEWPAIEQTARRQRALLLFADEASFAQWGSLGYTWALRASVAQREAAQNA